MHFVPDCFPAPIGGLPWSWVAGRLVESMPGHHAPGAVVPAAAGSVVDGTMAPCALASVPLPATLASAVPRRRATFAGGRLAMQAALERAGYPAPAPWVARAASGAPVMPTGWVGSIAHTDEICVAAAAPDTVVGAIGVDCEAVMTDAVARSVWAQVAPELPEVDERLSASPLSFAQRLTLAFAAKESLFKALHPRVGRFFGMEAARCTGIDPDARTVTLALTTTLDMAWPTGTTFVVDWTLHDDHAVTVLALSVSLTVRREFAQDDGRSSSRGRHAPVASLSPS
jgi:enterobactin synthetase component D